MATEVRENGLLVGAQGERWSLQVQGNGDVVVNVSAPFDGSPPMGEGVVVEVLDLTDLAAALSEILSQ